MAKDPAFLFYSSDFLTGTMLMTNEQVGKYIRLLCLQHQKGRFTEKDMLSICKAYDEDVLSKFSKDKDGKFYNERLEKEMTKRQLYTESRRKNGLHPKKKEAYAEHMGDHMENENKKEELVEFEKFNEWIEKHASNVSKMKEPFTFEQYEEAKKKFDKNVVRETLLAMHNHKPLLKNNISAYLTLCNWIGRRTENSTSKSPVVPLEKVPTRLKKANA